MNTEILKTPRFGITALVVVHFFGVLGILSPMREPFLVMTPLTLLLSLVALLITQERLSGSQALAVIGIFFGGYAVEVLGVSTGFPFGEYAYGPVLGPAILEVPPLIGINWVLVVLAASALASKLSSDRGIRIVLAAGLMTGFDWVLEPVAVSLNFWRWAAHDIPLSNYAAWFVISLVFCAVWQSVAQERLTRDRTSYALFWIQLAFFGALRLVSA